MNYKKLITGFIMIFAISLAVSIIITFLWNLIFHQSATVDWGTSFRLAIFFGIVFSVIDVKKQKGKKVE